MVNVMENNQYIQDYVENYRDTKEVWLTNFNKSHGTTSMFLKENHIRGFVRKKPWYMLSKRDSVPINKGKERKPLNRTELMEGYVQHKLKKWIKNNPCPVEKDDMYYSQYFPEWDTKRQSAEEYLREAVINKYTNKLSLVGRFKTSEEKYEEHEVAKVTDKFNETVTAGGVNKLSVKSKVMRKAQRLTNITKKKNPTCICTNLKDHKRQRGRILLPEVKMAA